MAWTLPYRAGPWYVHGVMRILHVLSQTPDFTGSGKYVQEIIRRSRARGHENFLVAGVPGDYSLPDSVLEPQRCELVRFDGPDLDFPVAGMSDAMPYASSVFSCMEPQQLHRYGETFRRAIARAVERFKPSILHTNHLWFATAAARQAAPNLPLVATCHGTCLRQHGLCPGLGRELAEALGAVDRVVALFPEQKEEIHQLLDLPVDRIDVIGGGFDQGCFYHEPRADHDMKPERPPDTATGTVHILYAGKLNEAKGVPWLLRTMDRLADLPLHLHLAGGGNGPEKRLCLELAEALESRATVHGTLSHAELGGLMRRAHIFVLPSFFEGLPLVLLEALACACRIVTTDLPGARELFSPTHPDMVRLVELPPLETIDTPRQEDWPLLHGRLEAALREAAGAVLAGTPPNLDYADRMARPYTWERIFQRIEGVYGQALAACREGR